MAGGRGVAGLVWAGVLALAVAGCDRAQMTPQDGDQPTPAATGPRLVALRDAAQNGPGLHLAYTHAIGLELPAQAVQAHFEAARARCLADPAHHCILLYASIGAAPPPRFRPVPAEPDLAILRVRLAHDQVDGFTAALTAPLPGEAPGVVRIVDQASTADDLGQPVADAAQRVAQFTDYMAALKVLGARLTISVSDQVKVAEETARTQTQLEEALARQRELAQRVDTEEVDVTLSAARPPVRVADPVTQVLAGAQESLRRNAAEALGFGIAALPWVPVGLVGLLVLWIARRAVFGRRARRVVG